MSYIRINKINWTTNPSANQTVSIQHKVTGGVYGAFDTITQVVDVNGFLLPYFLITGLLSNTSYTVKISNNCGGTPIEQVYITPNCPDPVTISGTGGGGVPF